MAGQQKAARADLGADALRNAQDDAARQGAPKRADAADHYGLEGEKSTVAA